MECCCTSSVTGDEKSHRLIVPITSPFSYYILHVAKLNCHVKWPVFGDSGETRPGITWQGLVFQEMESKMIASLKLKGGEFTDYKLRVWENQLKKCLIIKDVTSLIH